MLLKILNLVLKEGMMFHNIFGGGVVTHLCFVNEFPPE
jgi:hypothetical protein